MQFEDWLDNYIEWYHRQDPKPSRWQMLEAAWNAAKADTPEPYKCECSVAGPDGFTYHVRGDNMVECKARAKYLAIRAVIKGEEKCG